MNQPEDNFIGRWSRRKRDQQTPEPPAVAEEEATTEVVGESGALATPVDNPVAADADRPLTDADMAPVDSLDGNSDYAPFLSEGVSSELRKAALKKLFFSGKFAARDGLDDYDDDFTYFEPLGDTVTSDMKYHARRKERERLARLEEEAAASETEAAQEVESPAEPSDEADSTDKTLHADEGDTDQSDSAEPSNNNDSHATGAVKHASSSPEKEPANAAKPGSAGHDSGPTS